MDSMQTDQKLLKQLATILGIILVSIVVIATAIWLANYHTGTPVLTVSDRKCTAMKQTVHIVVIKDDKTSPAHTMGKLCDKLTITNLDNEDRLIAFGQHEHHTPYDNVTERLLGKNQSLTVTMTELGNYKFHDHIHDEVQGTFTVTDN